MRNIRFTSRNDWLFIYEIDVKINGLKMSFQSNVFDNIRYKVNEIVHAVHYMRFYIVTLIVRLGLIKTYFQELDCQLLFRGLT